MKSIWNLVLTAAVAVLALGVICILVGAFTGGSVSRMVDVVFGGREGLDMLLELIKTELAGIF